MNSQEVTLVITIAAVFFLPGAAFLVISGLSRYGRTLQNGCLAIAISVAFYPVIFYWSRDLLPSFHIGRNKLIVLLLVSLIITIAGLVRGRLLRPAWSASDWVAVGIFALVVFNRFWMAHLYPYPAWTDSLHHTLLTQMTAETGQLPRTLEPYAPIPLEMYHLGLYALTGTVQMLTNVPAYTALVWTAQYLNALCVIGVFLLLDRKVSRKAALVGSVVVGLLSFQPAWYINWGRFTQLSSQAILLVGWLLTWETIHAWVQPEGLSKRFLIGLLAASVLLNGAIFELHFRVAVYYLPLLLVTLLWELFQARQVKAVTRFLTGTFGVGLLTVLVILPVLLGSLAAYIKFSAADSASTSSVLMDMSYYQTSEAAIWSVGLQPWLLVLTAISIGLGLARRNLLSILLLVWVALLWLEGHTYLAGIPILNFTNYGAVVILYYLPASLLIGIGAHEIFCWFPRLDTQAVWQPALVILLVGGVFASHVHASTVEPYRFFITDADLQAMSWIKANTPPKAMFAVNTLFWLKNSVHGMDGGYWIPYFTGRQTTAANMIFTNGPQAYRDQVIALSHDVVSLKKDPGAVTRLCQQGVGYIYLGTNDRFSAERLSPAVLAKAPGVKLVYDSQGVKIYQACVP